MQRDAVLRYSVTLDRLTPADKKSEFTEGYADFGFYRGFINCGVNRDIYAKLLPLIGQTFYVDFDCRPVYADVYGRDQTVFLPFAVLGVVSGKGN